MGRIRTITIVALCLALWTPLAVGSDYITHLGMANPPTEGWAFTGGAHRYSCRNSDETIGLNQHSLSQGYRHTA